MQSSHMIKQIEVRLDEWADWVMRNNELGLGYPKQSVEAYLMLYGNVVIQKSSRTTLADNSRAEEIEKYIGQLAKQTRILADALRIYYLTVGTMPQKAKKLHTSYAQLKVYLNMAKQWLAGRLSI